MTSVLAVFLAMLGTLIIGLTLFGGGQLSIPLFQWLWTTLEKNSNLDSKNLDYDTWIAITNFTPGLVSAKLAAITGFLIAHKYWSGLLLLFLTYTVFVIPAILMIHWAHKILKKINKKRLLVYLNWLKPVIIGILWSLIAQLLLAMVLTQHKFNAPFKYWKFVPDPNPKATFFVGWRLYALWVIVPSLVLLGWYGYYKKINFLIIFLIAITFSMIVLEPWLKTN